MLRPRNAVVLGAGLMGRQIAAHLAGHGLRVHLADRHLPNQNPHHLAETAMEELKGAKPPAFLSGKDSNRITCGSFQETEDGYLADPDLIQALDGANWVVEAVLENLDVKRRIMAMTGRHTTERAIISTNSSGLNPDAIAEGLPPDRRERFLVTHWFNPVRQMELLELVPGDKTPDRFMRDFKYFAERVLGKRVVEGKPTPNFAGNRLGVMILQWILHHIGDFGLRVEEADLICDLLGIGRPFDTLDIVDPRLEIEVARTTFRGCPDDLYRVEHDSHPILNWMKEQKMGGRKTPDKGGFYRSSGQRDARGKLVLHSLNLLTRQHGPQEIREFPSVKAAKAAKGSMVGALDAFFHGEDDAARFARELTVRRVCYAANLVGTICDNPWDADNALRWGFNHKVGPFESIRLVGADAIIGAANNLGVIIPEGFLKSSRAYNERRTWLDNSSVIEGWQRHGGSLEIGNDHASALLNVTGTEARNVVIVNLHKGTMNPMTPEALSVIEQALDHAEEQGFGFVLTSDGPNFCAGADLKVILSAMEAGPGSEAWRQVEKFLDQFVRVCQRLHHATIPTVAAVHGYVLGGGAELAMACSRVVAADETYMGLVETDVGIIPGGGGTLRMLERTVGRVPSDIITRPECDLAALPLICVAFDLIVDAKRSGSAQEALELGYLLPETTVLVPGSDINRVIETAVKVADHTCQVGYRPVEPQIFVLPSFKGKGDWFWGLGSQVDNHNRTIERHLALVLCGGDNPRETAVSEDDLLKLERAAFFALCQEPLSRARVEHMLTTGKPLKN